MFKIIQKHKKHKHSLQSYMLQRLGDCAFGPSWKQEEGCAFRVQLERKKERKKERTTTVKEERKFGFHQWVGKEGFGKSDQEMTRRHGNQKKNWSVKLEKSDNTKYKHFGKNKGEVYMLMSILKTAISVT